MKLTLRTLLLCLLSGVFILSCQREVDGEVNPNPGGGNPPPAGNVTAGIRGTVVDENDVPVTGATVSSGTQTTTTDRYGVFRFSNISLNKANGFVKVTRPGYFNGVRSFVVTAGRIHNLRIKLIPKTNSESFAASTGGTVNLTAGAKMVMPANAIVDNSGAAYSGTVNVAMTWIDPTTADFPDVLPGDLRGITTGGTEMGLESFGMIGVEISTMSGQPLKIASGKTAELSFPIPASILGQAPATIDLWHFDEATGRWKQEGQAIKAGNLYIAQVSHFSFWNCDAPFPLVDLCMTVVHTSTSQPLNNIQVRIYRPDNSYGSGYTDSLGNLCGKVPKDEPLILKVLDRCNNVVYTQNIGPFSANTNLGNVSANVTTNTVTVTGTVTNCSGGNVTNGAALVFTTTGHSYSVPVSAGTFSLVLIKCDPDPITVSVIGVDYATQQQGIAVSGTTSTGSINVGTVQACGTSTEQYMDFVIDGVPFTYSTPTDNFFTVDSTFGTPPPYFYTPRASKPNNMMASFSFMTSGTAGPGQQMTYLYVASPAGNSFNILTPSPTLTLTSIGPVMSGFMEGNFNVMMDFGGTPRNVSCNFRVRRP